MKRTTWFLFGILALSALTTMTWAGPKKSLYERIGGIHKLAAAVDMSVDAEAEDAILNANPRVKMANQMGSRAFVKFAVTNTLAAGAGGPQKCPYSVAPFTKWFEYTPEQAARAWEIREIAFQKVGISKEDFMELKAWYQKAEKMAKPMMPAAETFKNKDSLYARLGGVAAISMVVNDFVDMLAADPTITANQNVVMSFTSGHITAPGLKYLVTEQLAAASGGPYIYSGRSMKASHHGLMITEKEWQAGANILKKVLDKYNVPAKEQGEVFSVITSTHDDIVGH